MFQREDHAHQGRVQTVVYAWTVQTSTAKHVVQMSTPAKCAIMAISLLKVYAKSVTRKAFVLNVMLLGNAYNVWIDIQLWMENVRHVLEMQGVKDVICTAMDVWNARKATIWIVLPSIANPAMQPFPIVRSAIHLLDVNHAFQESQSYQMVNVNAILQ